MTENHFFEHLSSELSLDNKEEAKPLVASVLQAIRSTLARANAESFITKLPDFLKSCLRGSDEGKQIPVEHLDELVALVMERDKKNDKSLFKSEIQALSVILFTLRKLFYLMDPASSGISQPICREVEEASLGISI